MTSKKWRTLGSGRRPGCKSSWPSPKACSSSFIFPNGAYLHCSYETMGWMFVSMNRWMDALYDCMYLTTSTNVDTWTRDWNSTFRKFDNRTTLSKNNSLSKVLALHSSSTCQNLRSITFTPMPLEKNITLYTRSNEILTIFSSFFFFLSQSVAPSSRQEPGKLNE